MLRTVQPSSEPQDKKNNPSRRVGKGDFEGNWQEADCPEALWLVEEGDLWPYPEWWPKLSKELKSPIPLPGQLKSPQDKKKAVENLLVPLRHIEVVSIVLRFIFPEEFGIMSPPVLGLLNVVPGPDSVSQYLRYLSALGKLRERYQQKIGLKNIADYDMALWTAAHLEGPDDVDRLRDEMEKDKDFQEIRLSNLLEGLGARWGPSIRKRLLLAQALLRHDHVAAAVIAARCYEQIICHVGKLVRKDIVFGVKTNPVGQQLRVIADEDEVRRRGVNFEKLNFWLLRCDAVHGIPSPQTGQLLEIREGATGKLLRGVQELRESFDDILPAG